MSLDDIKSFSKGNISMKSSSYFSQRRGVIPLKCFSSLYDEPHV